MLEKNYPGHRTGIFSVHGKIRTLSGTDAEHLFGGKGELWLDYADFEILMDVSTADPYNDRTTVSHVVAHVFSQLNKHPPEVHWGLR